MSRILEAIVFYGIRVHGCGKEMDEFVSAWCDLHVPEPDDSDGKSSAWDQWRESVKAWEKTIACVETGIYGYDGNLKRFIHCGCLEHSVRWDAIKELPKLSNHPEGDEQIKKFCKRFGIPYRKPKWHLVALYF